MSAAVAPDGPPEGPQVSTFGQSIFEGLRWLSWKTTSFLYEPRYRTLRWVLLVGLVVRLLLAPLTSWGIDTPFFAFSEVRFLQTGSPYGGNTFFNPPFGPVAELPDFALVSLFRAPGTFVQYVPALLPLAVRTQMVVPYLPTPGVLLALKAPLIASDALVALLVYHVVRPAGGTRAGTLAAAAWFLNPLVIWASSVHGEVDVFAALLVLAALVALHHRWAFVAGTLLGLGFFAKIYPALLLPMAVALIALDAPRGSGWRPRLPPVGRLLGGFAFSAIPFVPLLGGFAVVLAHQSGNVNYGGLSVLIAFNPNITSIAHVWPPGTAGKLALAMEGTAALAVVGSVAAVVYGFYRPERRPEGFAMLSLLALWVVSGAILAILSTQAENVVAILPLLLASAAAFGRLGRPIYWGASLSAWVQYLTLLTPVAFFYPLLSDIGPGAVASANSIVIPYALGRTAVTQGTAWVLCGLVGGSFLIAVWAATTRSIVRRLRAPTPAATPAAVASTPPPPRPPVSRRWRTAVGPAPRSTVASLGTALVVLTFTAQVGLATALLVPPPPILTVETLSVTESASGVSVTIHVQSGAVPVQVHLGLVPGHERSVGPVYLFADTQYPDTYDSYTQTHEVGERIALALAQVGIDVPVSYIGGGALPSLLRGPPTGTLVVLGGVVPDTVLSNSTALLPDWVAAGGTLIWAGGPVGGEEGHPTHGPFNWDPLDWAGQLKMVGYPMTDPGAVGPLFGFVPSNLGEALGISYNGTPTGANTSALAGHGGLDLGFDGTVGPGGANPRSSLVYQPDGLGRIYYFGGSFSAQTRPLPEAVPGADLGLSNDLTLLISTGFVPAAGPVDSANAGIAAFSSGTFTLAVPGGSVANGLVLVVTAPALPAYLSIWSGTIKPPAGP